MYSHRSYTTACPYCHEAKVSMAAWDGDCRGNDGGYSIACGGCKASFTWEKWQVVAAAELQALKRDRVEA